jgi:hypothetical protein
MEPQCVLNGILRAEHRYGPTGLCACGAIQTAFASRPPHIAPRAARPTRTSATQPPTQHKPPATREKRIANTTFTALIADLEAEKTKIDHAIAAIRKVEEFWPA